MSTSLDEFEKWLSLLPWPPWLIPVKRHSKEPDTEGSTKDAKCRLTVEQARERIRNGDNVGVMATGRDLVFVDHDQPSKFILEKQTLTVITRNGKIHKHYLNGGDVKNADGKGQYKGCGEVRAEWKYVLAPGSYVPPDKDAALGATGLYEILIAKPLATLYAEDLPVEFRPNVPEKEEKPTMAGSFRNEYGWSLEDICGRDEKLQNLLSTVDTAGYASPSEADMATLTKLLFWGYSPGESVDILRHFRPRDKLSREDYIRMTLGKVSQTETIADKVDVKKWHPAADTKKKKRRRQKGEGEKDENETPVRFLPFMELPDGRLAEEGFDGKEVYFLVYDSQTGKTERKQEVALEGFVLQPIDNDEVRDRTVLLPSDVEEYESEDKLMEGIRGFLNRWHEPPSPLSRTLDGFYTFLTYIKDLVPQLPYRRYLAPWGKGKSAWLETLGWICYRGIILAGSDTDKSVVRKMNNWQGTGLIDEADFGDSSFYAFLIKILNIGYDRKTGFYHRSDDNDPNKILSYSVYGPKLLATRAKYKDLALESRCLTTIGRQNVNPIPLFRMTKFCDEAVSLRNKLTLWRFKNYYRVKETASELEEPHIAEKVYDGANNISSRVKQVILPLWLIGGDSMKETLTKLAETFDRRLKIEDPDYLLELQARDAVKEIAEALESEDEETVNIRNMVNVLFEAPQDPIYEMPLSLISKTILKNKGANEDEITVSDVTSVSKRLKGVFETNLGFNIRIGKKRRRVVQIPSRWLGQAEEAKTGGLEDFV
jgi:hypothetical protein